MAMNIVELKESLRLAEKMASLSLSKASQSKTNFFQKSFNVSNDEKSEDEKPYVPPKSLLLYLVRMGSFTSKPQIKAKEYDDETVSFPSDLEDKFLLDWVKEQMQDAPPLPKRKYRQAPGRGESVSEAVPFRLFQWNILAQALGTHADNFVSCPPKALNWETRRLRILEEILVYDPDIVCLQEVDHFKFFERALGTQGFVGYFVPKPDSPCIYLPENNGPDGCALFFRSDRFELVDIQHKILEVWKVPSNQVAIMASLRDLISGQDLVVITTHLKARKGALLASLRQEQGVELLTFLKKHQQGRAAIMCGDFNAEPSEPVYATMTDKAKTDLSSVYSRLHGGQEPPYSTWKIRGDGEMKHNIDYIFYTDDQLTAEGVVDAPTEEEIGPGRVPSLAYPSDHFSLISDFTFSPEPPTRLQQDFKGRQ